MAHLNDRKIEKKYVCNLSGIDSGGGCRGPELTLNGTPVAARQNANPDYSTLTEIKFTAQLPVPTTNRKHRTCKIKCVNGEWVGPLCQGKMIVKGDLLYL